MKINLYFFSFDIDENASDVINKLQEIGKTCSCLSNGWFIRTDKDEEFIYNAVQPLFDNGKGRFIISPIDLNTMNGWISTDTIKWLKEQ